MLKTVVGLIVVYAIGALFLFSRTTGQPSHDPNMICWGANVVPSNWDDCTAPVTIDWRAGGMGSEDLSSFRSGGADISYSDHGEVQVALCREDGGCEHYLDTRDGVFFSLSTNVRKADYPELYRDIRKIGENLKP